MSGNDPLAQYRKKPVPPPGETTPPKASDGYVAFDAKDKVDRLKIRRQANNPTRSPAYVYLLDVVYDGEFGTGFILLFTFLKVSVRGRNLQPVIAALEMGVANFIQEYDAEKWPMPKDAKAPFIETIAVVAQDGGPILSPSDKKQPGSNLH